jgi:hypothetical protein
MRADFRSQCELMDSIDFAAKIRLGFPLLDSFASGDLLDRSAGQDLEDVQFFLKNDFQTAQPFDVMLHGAYGLPYLSYAGLERVLPQLLILSLNDRFRYQPLIDTIVMGAFDYENGWGRHVAKFPQGARDAVLCWLNFLNASGKYDPYWIRKAEDALSSF